MLQPISFIQTQFPYLTDADAQKLLTLGKVSHFEVGDLFIEAGETTYNFALVVNGMLRNYHSVEGYDDKTVVFSVEGQSAMSSATVFMGQPSTDTIEAVEDTSLLVFNFQDVKALSQENPRIAQIINENLVQRLVENIARVHDFVLRSPEERYVRFADENPALLERVQQKHLASFLGITPISLSRIKARLLKKSA
ncbi:MAG: Crp/Fnr family transcriptional regulator [Flavobacteriales bacterium]